MFWKRKDRGAAFINPVKCGGCGKCANICRHHVPEMTVAGGKRRAVIYDTALCSGCGKCVVICPQRAIEII